MKVVVASGNPIKMACTQKAFTEYFTDQKIEFDAQAADSEVSEQPMTIDEAIQGAINRAQNVASGQFDYAVGIEGGLSFHEVGGREHAIEISWVCVYDCQNNRYEIASAPGFPILPKVLGHIHQGQHLSQAMETEYGLKNLGQQNGYIGWLSGNKITRQSSNYEAVLLALSSLNKEPQL